MINKFQFSTIAFSLFAFSLSGQFKSSSDIYSDLGKLKSPYRVLYIAAHPDDENTRLISFFNGEFKARTAYLSLTRGEGGQNLIGDEKGPLLGVIRTEELLAARKIDGGEQFFTRGIDFGYSKTSDETFSFWDKEKILSDVVYILRYFKPHIVINRFPLENYDGHGHHRASALLSSEAFDKSGDATYNTEENNKYGIWKVGTLYQNTSSWWDKSIAERAKNDASVTVLNVGKYNVMQGYSYSEISALSRSQHKSQGFGSAPSTGEQLEYLDYLKGDYEPSSLLNPTLLDDTDRKWLETEKVIDSIMSAFNFQNPSSIVPALIKLKNTASGMDSNGRFEYKIKAIDELIANCLGFSAELIVQKAGYNPGKTVTVKTAIINRSATQVILDEITCGEKLLSWNRPLIENELLEDTFSFKLDPEQDLTSPYWLFTESENRYNHDQQKLENPSGEVLSCLVTWSLESARISTPVKIEYKWTDRIKGGLKKELAVLPAVHLKFDKSLYFPKQGIISGNIIINSNIPETLSGKLIIKTDSALKVTYTQDILLNGNGILTVPFSATADLNKLTDQKMSVCLLSGTDTFCHYLNVIEYDHIRPRNVLLPAHSAIVPVELPVSNGKIACIEGPDNEVVDLLKEAGCDIETFEEEYLINGKLKEFRVLLFGIRSLNVNKNWNNHHAVILDFIKKGGVVVVLYQTDRDVNPIRFSPYPFEVSRLRITNEKSKTNILKPEHAILNYPFKLTKTDFEGWKQERGLYFADKWDDKFTTLLSWHDEGELDLFGGIIAGDYGKGAFIYTGISFFRSVPAGNAGAYKLLYNMLSYKNE